ncbi:MAG: transposase [Pseudomonadota bacterium]
MPRRLRLHLPGGFYHATLRGNHQQALFRAESDRRLLDAIVQKSLLKYGARLHAYCWMTNHLHFLVQVSDEPLGGVMREIASNYARAFQKMLPTTGHLFERRYHAMLVDTDSYLLELLRYIHLNPVKAGMARRVSDYPWSSHRAYAGSDSPSWLSADFILAMFAPDKAAAHAAYRKFIADSSPENEFDETRLEQSGILGDEEFVARVAASLSVPARPNPTIPRARLLTDLLGEACRRFTATEQDLLSDARDAHLVKARGWFAREATTARVATLSEVARFLKRDRATLRYAMRQLGEEARVTAQNPT